MGLRKMDYKIIEELFEIQYKQNNYWYDSKQFKVDNQYRMNVIKDYALGIYDQTSKMLDTTDWKKHLIESEENSYNMKMQIIDIIKYAFGLLIFEGVGEAEFLTLFKMKSKLLEEKWESQKWKANTEMKVAIFDIDGCIADYPKAYEKFLGEEKGLVSVMSSRKSYYFCDRYGITKQQEEQYHSEFIESGGFLNLEVFKGAIEVIKKVKKAGIKVVLLTARPSWIHKRVYVDTFEWLRKKCVPYDLLLWNKDKADATIKHIFPAQILFMIEDRDKHAIEMAHIGVYVMLLDKEYNQGVISTDNVERFKNWMEIEERVEEIIISNINMEDVEDGKL